MRWAQSNDRVRVLRDHSPTIKNGLAIEEGEVLQVLKKTAQGWWWCLREETGEKGYVSEHFVQVCLHGHLSAALDNGSQVLAEDDGRDLFADDDSASRASDDAAPPPSETADPGVGRWHVSARSASGDG
jgi:hypothetical protein